MISFSSHDLARLLLLARMRVLGSAKSGNFGHSGRKGEVGGSGPGQGGGGADQKFRAPGKADVARVKDLRIPPGWKHVRLNPNPKAPLQATGIDAKGRKQYRYSAKHSEKASAEKFGRLKAFNGKIGGIRKNVSEDLQSKDPGVRDAAAVVHVIDKTGFRVGSELDTKADQKAHGVTTLEAKHVKVQGDTVHFRFVGKKGVEIRKSIKDPELAKVIQPRLKDGGQLFKVSDAQVRDYMKERVPGFTPKDFRTWHGTVEALKAVKSMPKPQSEGEHKKAVKAVATRVAQFLGNTPAVALSSYIDPSAFSRWGGRRKK